MLSDVPVIEMVRYFMPFSGLPILMVAPDSCLSAVVAIGKEVHVEKVVWKTGQVESYRPAKAGGQL